MYDKVDDEVIKYYENCKSNYEKSIKEDQSEVALLIVSSLNIYGVRVCRHTMITMLMEQILKEHESPQIVSSLFRSINLDLECVISSKYASHLLEKVLLSCKNKEISNNELVQFQCDTFSEYMWLHYPDYLENDIGSHIVRMFFQFVCGVYISMEGKVYSPTNAILFTPMQKDYKNKLASLVKRFLLSPCIDQILTNKLMSAMLQTLLVICCIRDENLFSSVSKALLSSMCNISKKVPKEERINLKIPDSFADQHKSYLIECLILSLPEGKLYNKFTKQFLVLLKDKFVTLSLTNPICCGILKALIYRSKNIELIKDVSVTILNQLIKLQSFDCGNVFLNLINEFIKKIPLFQVNEHECLRKYKNSILEILLHLANIENDVSLIKLLSCGLKDQDKNDDDDNNNFREHEKICSLSASITLQSVINTFSPFPKSILKMFLNLSDEQLFTLCCNAKASRIIEYFITSKNVSNENKTALLKMLSCDQMNNIAKDKFGSRILDAVFNTSNYLLVNVIKEKLELKKSSLKFHKIGKFIVYKLDNICSKEKKNDVNKLNSYQKKFNNKKVKTDQIHTKRNLGQSLSEPMKKIKRYE